MPIWDGSDSTAWATGGNWVGGSAPATSAESAIFDYTSASGNGVAGSDQTATTLDDLIIKATFSGSTQFVGSNGTPLAVKATRTRIGEASGADLANGTGAGRINLDLSTVASTITVFSTATSSIDTNKEPVRIKCNSASTKLTVISGRVGVATDLATDTATIGEIGLQGSGATVNVSSGVTLTTFRQSAGTGLLYCGMTTLAQDGGTVTTMGTGAITSADIGGEFISNSSGTITTLEIFTDGSTNLLQSITARTVTTVKMHAGATLSYDPAVVTITNPIQLLGCTLEDVTINVPRDCTVAVVAA